MSDELTTRLATSVTAARKARGLSPAALAERSGVSRAMIGKIERGEAQATAALLARLSGALGLTLSQLIAQAEKGDRRRLARRADQPIWTDPISGYTRRALSPPAGHPLELIEVELPPETEVEMPADAYRFIHQQIWVIKGRLHFREGDTLHDLRPGDCLQLGPAAPCSFINPTRSTTRYLVALHQRQ